EMRTSFRYSLYDVEQFERRERKTIWLMRRFFFAKWIPRYNDDIFFMTPFFHRVFAGKLQRAIFLDADLQFRADIADLWAKFAEFTKDNLIGIAPDLQPHYRAEFSLYRRNHSGTDVGLPRPGKQGFNTGVMLMDFGRMSNSKRYNNLLVKKSLLELTQKYEFYGYLGHQDFFTILGIEYPEMFYLLDCTWNRQLDTSWKVHYNLKIFELYHRCPGPIRIYHGNGNNKIPPEPTSGPK
ncbi:xyloside xylosyltransferase 1-like, partial [Tropilaelaps mercedesae]